MMLMNVVLWHSGSWEPVFEASPIFWLYSFVFNDIKENMYILGR